MNNVVTTPPKIINWIERECSLISVIIFERRATIDLTSDCNVIIFHFELAFIYWLLLLGRVWPNIDLYSAWLRLTILLACFSLCVDLYYSCVSDHTLTYTACLYSTIRWHVSLVYVFRISFWKKVENLVVILLVFYRILIISLLYNNIRMTCYLYTAERIMYHYTRCI